MSMSQLPRIPLLVTLAVAIAPVLPGQNELQKLRASDGAAHDAFSVGFEFSSFFPPVTEAIAVSADSILIGASWHDDAGTASGAVFVYELSAGGWIEVDKLLPSDGGTLDRFGASIDIDSDVAVIGAVYDDGGYGPGSAYVYERVAGKWVETAKLTPSDGAQFDWFGNFVEVSADTILVGAMFHDAVIQDSGAAYVFERTVGGWVETAKLFNPAGKFDDQFGVDGALEGDVAVIGAWHDSEADFWSGKAFVYERIGGAWVKTDEILPDDVASNDQFGSALALSSGTLLAGAEFEDHAAVGAGAAYVFQKTANGWVQEAKLIPSDGVFGDWFGVSVDLLDGVALVGAGRKNVINYWSGGAYVFESTAAGWVETGQLSPSDPGDQDHFGLSVALGRGLAVIGAPFDDDLGDDSGSAYVFALAESIGTNYCAPANLNSTGQSAVISALGSTNPGANLLTLTASQLPPNVFGYFLNSDVQDFTAFPPGSEGNLCLGGGIGRHVKQVGNTGAGGELVIDVDLTALPRPNGTHSVVAGETWNFQCWFRDANPGPTSNFTDGIEILFQ